MGRRGGDGIEREEVNKGGEERRGEEGDERRRGEEEIS